MAPWSHIAKPFSLFFALNCIKTVVGAGFVGYGVALALTPLGDEDDEAGDDSAAKSTQDNHSSGVPTAALVRKYVRVTTTIGFGLFLSLPSLASQIVWETTIPGITATDIAYDLGWENVKGVIPKWKLPDKPKFSSLVHSKEKFVEGLKEAMTEDSSEEKK